MTDWNQLADNFAHNAIETSMQAEAMSDADSADALMAHAHTFATLSLACSERAKHIEFTSQPMCQHGATGVCVVCVRNELEYLIETIREGMRR